MCPCGETRRSMLKRVASERYCINVLLFIWLAIVDIQERNDMMINFLNIHDSFEHFEERIKNTTKEEIIKLIDEIFIEKQVKFYVCRIGKYTK